MRIKQVAMGCLLSGLVSGCASIRGTWTADKTGEAQSPIAAVSFCHDGTFTAHAEYDKQSRGSHGRYEFDGKKLSLDAEGSNRVYPAVVRGDELFIVHEGRTYLMKRFE